MCDCRVCGEEGVEGCDERVEVREEEGELRRLQVAVGGPDEREGWVRERGAVDEGAGVVEEVGAQEGGGEEDCCGSKVSFQ